MSEAALRDFSGTARLFPLPGVVLFPHVIQGLHIFEPRYRQMVADALAGDRLIAIVLLQPDADETSDRPAVEPVACLGHIGWHEQLSDGRYNLRLRGVSRVRIVEELPDNRLYRSARVEVVADTASPDLAALAQLRRDLAAVVLPRFAGEPISRQQLEELFDGEDSLGRVCDGSRTRLMLETGGEVAVPLATAGRLQGAAVELGVRPEHLVLDAAAPLATAPVEMAEKLGESTVIHFAGKVPLVAKLPGTVECPPGTRLALGADPARLHLFHDGESLRV